MADLQYDGIDLPGVIIYLIGALATLGWAELSVPLTDIVLSDTLWTLTANGYSSNVSLATLLTLLGIFWIAATNDLGWRGWSALQIWIVASTIWMVISPPFVPLMHAILMGSEWAKVIAFSLQTIGVGLIAYLG